jgi:hypothetical protein
MKKIILMLILVSAVFVTNVFGQSSTAGFQMNGTILVKYTGNAKEVVIPSNVTAIGNSAFNQTAITYVQIPSSVTSIGDGAFNNCQNLTVVAISEGVKTIGVQAFNYNIGLTRVNIPTSVTSIGIGAFRDCHNLQSVTFSLPSKLTSISANTFNGCRELRYFIIPQGITEIGDWAFLGTVINEITIPASVKSIGAGAFTGLYTNEDNARLEKITFEGIPSIDLNKSLGLHLLRLGGGTETYTRTRTAAGEFTAWVKQTQTQTPAVQIQEPVQVQQPISPGGKQPPPRR